MSRLAAGKLGRWLSERRPAGGRHADGGVQPGGVRRGLLAVAFLAAGTLVLATAVLPSQVSLRAGQVAPETIKAPRDFLDRPATDRLRQDAAANVADVFAVQPTVTSAVLAAFDHDVVALQEIRQRTKVSAAEQLAALRQAVLLAAPDGDYAAVLGIESNVLSELTSAARSDLSAALEGGVRPDQLDTARAALASRVRQLPYPSAAANDWFAVLVSSLLQPNLAVDPVATQRAREQAAAAVQPVFILKGQAIVHEGDPITEDEVTRLRDAGLLRERGGVGIWLGALALAALLEAGIAVYLGLFRPDTLRQDSRLLLLGCIALVAIAGTRLGLSLSGYLSPLPWAAMLAAVCFDPQLAVFLVAVLSLVPVLLGHDVGFGLAALAAGLAATFSLRRLHQRAELLRAGLLASAAGVAAVASLALFLGGATLTRAQLVDGLASALLSGVASGVLAIGTLPYLEYAFGLLTPMRLLELGNPQQPVLRRLLLEAPGTYHHSLMVANLAEAGCQAVGADGLLARVGAYYHDIGKMRRPYFFVENQFGGENPHERLSPNLSALIITSHVKDGVELARAHHLPEEIIRFIRTHHGTSLVTYFYQLAREGGELMESNFRYDGPLPERREEAVVMLADGVEAAVRSLQPAADKLEPTVRRLVNDRLDEGQLALCDLTLGDLERIIAGFVQVLNGIYHQRIEYPEQVLQEFRRTRGDRRQAAGS